MSLQQQQWLLGSPRGESKKKTKTKKKKKKRSVDRLPIAETWIGGLEMQSTDSGGDEKNGRIPAITNLFRSALESTNCGRVNCGGFCLSSDRWVLRLYVVSALSGHCCTHVNALVMRECRG